LYWENWEQTRKMWEVPPLFDKFYNHCCHRSHLMSEMKLCEIDATQVANKGKRA